MRKLLILLIATTAGCSRSDVIVLGRIGQRVEKKVEVVWKSDPNRRLIQSLPLLQKPDGSVPADGADGRTVPPRM